MSNLVEEFDEYRTRMKKQKEMLGLVASMDMKLDIAQFRQGARSR